MAVCLSSGLCPGKALELSASGTPSKALRTGVEVARQRCAQSMALADALEPAQRVFPHYVLPVIRAGETGGRLVEAFQLLHDHARRLGPSLSFGDAFARLTLLETRFKGMIATGAISGQLDRSLSAIVEEATSQLDAALQAFNQVFQRVVAFCVAMSIVETVFPCTL